MTLPDSVIASVSETVITKVARLFNGSLDDILNELLQNARRASATNVQIVTGSDAGQHWIEVIDDGSGVGDPSNLFALGSSGWDDEIAVREDPAGMGLFALAGRAVIITSTSADQGFRIAIPADGWTGKRTLQVESVVNHAGTIIRFHIPETWQRNVGNIVAKVARHYPLPVFFEGQAVKREGFLEGAKHIEEALGVRIGVYEDGNIFRYDNLNFHGVRISHKLPAIKEVKRKSWSVRIDVIDAPDLQLVLPARKEVVQTAFLVELEKACNRAIFNAIAKEAAHSLPYRHWVEARQMAIDLPPAEAKLGTWIPSTADDGYYHCDTQYQVPDNRTLLIPQLDPISAQRLGRAFEHNAGTLGFTALADQRAYAGYAWYDRLARLSENSVVVHRGDQRVVDDDILSLDDIEGRIDHAEILLQVDSSGNTREILLALDVVLAASDDCGLALDELTILVTNNSKIAPNELADLMIKAAFCPCDDAGADSYDTQRDNFRNDALYIAYHILESREAADIERIKLLFDQHVGWLVPGDQEVIIRFSHKACDIMFSTLNLGEIPISRPAEAGATN